MVPQALGNEEATLQMAFKSWPELRDGAVPRLTSDEARILQTWTLQDAAFGGSPGDSGTMGLWGEDAGSGPRKGTFVSAICWAGPLPLPALPVSSHPNLFHTQG